MEEKTHFYIVVDERTKQLINTFDNNEDALNVMDKIVMDYIEECIEKETQKLAKMEKLSEINVYDYMRIDWEVKRLQIALESHKRGERKNACGVEYDGEFVLLCSKKLLPAHFKTLKAFPDGIKFELPPSESE